MKMKTIKDVIPKTKNKVIQEIFLGAAKRAEEIIGGKPTSDETGPFNESLDLLSYDLAKNAGSDLTSFRFAKEVDERLLAVYRDILEDPTFEVLIDCVNVSVNCDVCTCSCGGVKTSVTQDVNDVIVLGVNHGDANCAKGNSAQANQKQTFN